VSELKSTIEQLETEIESTNHKIIELNKFRQYATTAILEEEISHLLIESEQRKVQQKLEQERLIQLHEQSILNTAKRADRIINAVEGVASQVGRTCATDNCIIPFWHFCKSRIVLQT
jgi:vacuolar-type H+-ATPase subunit I/STV1